MPYTDCLSGTIFSPSEGKTYDMENMNQLRDLLRHEINDLYSAEEQIIEALPDMIEKAKDASLKKTLREHLKVTEQQKVRLDEVRAKLDEAKGEDSEKENKGFLAGLFGKGNKECKGMKGLITEGNKVMDEDMTSDVRDAAIIACAQKIEHYEICGYGTARAYAQELNLDEVEQLLRQTLDEEYEADDLLTNLAVGRLNKEAMGPLRRRSTRSTAKKAAKKRSSGSRTTKTSRTKSRSRSKTNSRSKASSR